MHGGSMFSIYDYFTGLVVADSFMKWSSICHTLLLFADKPRITIPVPVVRTVPGHIVWCSAEGSPPINMSLLTNSTPFAYGTGIVAGKVYDEGYYTCLANNEAGSDSRHFPITFIGVFCLILFLRTHRFPTCGEIADTQAQQTGD